MMYKPNTVSTLEEYQDEIRKWRNEWNCPDGYAAQWDCKYGIFRGQSDYRWALRSKISRISIGRDLYNLEANFFNAWLRRHKPHQTVLKFDPQNRWEVLACAQHYGLPTRLLDWTTHPLHALFFACIGEPQNADGIVYGLIPSSLIELNTNEIVLRNQPPILNDDSYRVYLYQPDLNFSERLRNQMGLFTIQTKVTPEFPEALEEACVRSHSSQPSISSVRIDCAAKSYIEHTLMENGIGYEQMYPEPAGLAKQICREYAPDMEL